MLRREDEEGRHECQGWLLGILSQDIVEEDVVNQDKEMRRRRNLGGKDNGFGFRHTESERPL